MPHVLVPVPEEHVAEVTLGLMRLVLGMSGWQDGALVEMVAGLDGPSRALVREVAAVSAEHDRLPYHDAARALGVDVGTVLELVTTINDSCRRDGVPLPLVTDTMVQTTGEGEERAVPVLVIAPAVAKAMLGQLREEPGV